MTGLQVVLRQQSPIPLNAAFTCKAGNVLALVGPSGSGKSTILRCIAGLYHPTSGEVRCEGDVWYSDSRNVSLSSQQRRVGFVFQDFALMPHLSVLENVSLPLSGLTPVARKQRAIELLARVRLEGLEARKPGQLSGGQQQRVALARALARDPAVLLLDEPFSAVDQVTRRKLRREMVSLTRDLKIPIVLVTHDLDEASMLGDQLCVLHNGTTLQQGGPAELLERPASATVARLIDLRNLFEASVVGRNTAGTHCKINWNGIALDVHEPTDFAVGDKVCFCIAADKILLHQRVRPSNGVAENPANARIRDMISIGGVTSVLLLAQNGERLEMDLPPHVVQRNSLAVGDEVGVSLLAKSIHLMPWQSLH